MNIVFWGATLPLVLEQVSREASRASPKPRVSLQIDPSIKTQDYASHYFDEVVRQPAAQIAQLEKLMSGRREAPFLILDSWALLFDPSFEKILPNLAQSLQLASHVLVLMPRAWVGRWRGHAIYRESNAQQKAFLDMAFGRTHILFEELWNCLAPITCVEHSPTFELIEGMSGQKNLSPQRKFGLHFLPPDCRNHEARFATTSNLVKAILEFLGVISPGTNGEKEAWWVPVVSDKNYSARQSTDETQKPWYVFPRSWGNYAGSHAENGENLLRLFNSNQKEPLSSPLFAQWFYFLGVLEKEYAPARKIVVAQDLSATSLQS